LQGKATEGHLHRLLGEKLFANKDTDVIYVKEVCNLMQLIFIIKMEIDPIIRFQIVRFYVRPVIEVSIRVAILT
jgi:hypothetical protein